MYGYDGSIDWNMYFGNYDSDICLGMFRVSDFITMNIQQRKN